MDLRGIGLYSKFKEEMVRYGFPCRIYDDAGNVVQTASQRYIKLPFSAQIRVFTFFTFYSACYSVTVIMPRPDYSFIRKNSNFSG